MAKLSLGISGRLCIIISEPLAAPWAEDLALGWLIHGLCISPSYRGGGRSSSRGGSSITLEKPQNAVRGRCSKSPWNHRPVREEGVIHAVLGETAPHEIFSDGRRNTGQMELKYCTANGVSHAYLLINMSGQVMSRSYDAIRDTASNRFFNTVFSAT